MSASKYSSVKFHPNPWIVVECGSHSIPNYGCNDETESAVAAYTNALMWYYTCNKTHAVECIKIMNAWSGKITRHTDSNAPLQTGWAGSVWPRAAEIIRYTYTGWPQNKVKCFEKMLRNVYLPELENTNVADDNGNWQLTMCEAIGNIAVFLNDCDTFNRAVSMWRERLPAYIYIKSDGAYPKPPPNGKINTKEEIIKYWLNQRTFVDGLCQETCRDFGHVCYGLAAAANLAETAWHQGLDLYKEGQDRLVHAFEFHANYACGTPAPKWLCNGKININYSPTWEIVYNHYHNRMKINMPYTKKLLKQIRPTGSNEFSINWETMTHGKNINC